MTISIKKTEVAESVPFDKDKEGILNADNTQDAIDELSVKVGVSASPGFSWGRASNVSSNSWLLNDGVPSNRAGRTINLINPVVTAVSIANENINTFTIEFYEHDGDEINLSLLGSVDVINARSFSSFVNFPVTNGKQLAVYLSTGTARNVVVGLQLSGTVN